MASTLIKQIVLGPEHRNRSGSFPLSTRLEIIEDETGGFFLLHFTGDSSTSDTWHPTLEDALHQANYELEVKPEEWLDKVK